MIFALRPESLEKEGLVAALRKQAAALGARYQIAVVESLCAEPAIPLHVKQDLLRIAQEAMSNIAKHSRAGRVEVSLDSTPGFVAMTIADDGIGFDAGGEFPGHLGLQSIRERARDLGGDMELSTAPGRGTQIRVAVSASAGANDGSGD